MRAIMIAIRLGASLNSNVTWEGKFAKHPLNVN
jgi:hypothetical protein